MADGREDECQCNFSIHRLRKFKTVHICDERVVRSKGGISTDIRFRPNLSSFPALSVSSSAINIQ